MGVLTFLSIAAVIVAAVYSMIFEGKKKAPSFKNKEAGNSLLPDHPIRFGYNCVWFAAKTEEKHRLVELLKLKNAVDCNWKKGLENAYRDSVFITPAIDGWTLACGAGLPHGDSHQSIKKVKGLLKSLSTEFGEAQFFVTHSIVEYHGWMKAVNGNMERVYSFLGESGQNLAVEGNPTPVEQPLNLVNTLSPGGTAKGNGDQEWPLYPDEDTVMKIAESWSINPTQLSQRTDLAPGLGIVGKI